MGRIYGVIMMIMLCAPAGVQAECLMARALSQVHLLQLDLAKRPDDRLAENALRFIAGQIPHLQADDLAEIAAMHPADGADAVFTDFVDNTNRLLSVYESMGLAALPFHFQQVDVRSNLRLTGQYLYSLGCIPRGANARPGQGAVSMLPPDNPQEVANLAEKETDEETPFDGVKRYLATPSGAISGVLAIVGAGVAAFLIQTWMKRRRRRARRFDCHYATRYRIAGQDRDGVVLDVSGMGVKLRHNAEKSIQIGVAVDILILGEWHVGTVAWGNAHYVGVLFRQALRQRIVRELYQGNKMSVAQVA